MVGVTGCLAAGLHHRYGWKVVALAGSAAVVPDWDGLTIIGGVRLFDRAHRAWGHSVFSAAALGLLLGWLDYRFDLIGRAARLILRQRAPAGVPRSIEQRRWSEYGVWCLVAVAGALSHLAADLVVSGSSGLSDWELKLWWPLSQRGYVYSLVHWGDVGPTLIFVLGMFAMLRWPRHIRGIAAAALAGVVLYVAV